MRPGTGLFTVVALLAVATVAAPAELYAPETIARDFRVQWQLTRGAKGATIDGYVYNTAMRAAEHMRLQIERLDDAGLVVGSSTAVVLGTVPMDGRAYFRASVPEAASYRVQPVSFDWSCGGSAGAGGM